LSVKVYFDAPYLSKIESTETTESNT